MFGERREAHGRRLAEVHGTTDEGAGKYEADWRALPPHSRHYDDDEHRTTPDDEKAQKTGDVGNTVATESCPFVANRNHMISIILLSF